MRESFLITRFLEDSVPLSVAVPALRFEPARRWALVEQLGDEVGRLHAAGLDHADLKHSNLLVTGKGEIVWLDLDCLDPPRRLTWRRRVRALGQLEAYASDLYPWLPRSDRARFLRAYLRHTPERVARRRDLIAAVSKWARRRLADWSTRDRSDSLRYPLTPREVVRTPGPPPSDP